MALDNPSYFSLSKDSEKQSSDLDTISILDNISTSSDCSLTHHSSSSRSDCRAAKNGSRTLLRSCSSNSADSNQELLIMGKPRLTDMAPDIAFRHPSNKKEARRSNSLQNPKRLELQNNDLMYFSLPTSEDSAATATAPASEHSGDEEVFLSEDSARYYNFSASLSTPRRHSISTFATGRERSASLASGCGSFKEDFPQAVVHATAEGQLVGQSSISIDDHSLRHGSYPRKRCNRCTKKPLPKRADMDDILIISVKESEAASLWVDYFNSYFQHICEQANRKPFKIYHLTVEEIVETATNIKLIQERTSFVKLQLIVLCPSLLETISQNPNTGARFSNIILPDRTLALLLGVSDDDLTDVHRNAFPTYSQWQRLSVGLDQDENFTKEFLGTAVSILSRVWKQQTSIMPQQKSLFSVLPKKVRQGHGSVVIILTHPLQREDIVKVSIERNNEIIEIKNVKRRNPYTLKITIPDSCTELSAIVHILVEKNGSIIGSSPIKCESRLRELEQILRSSENPIEFMCQALGFSPANKEHMDNCLVYAFQKNMPPNFNLLYDHHSVDSHIFTHRHNREEYPTLLHFAARYGLEKLAIQLLDCPGGDIACDIKNSCDLTPAEIAQHSGHSDLAHTLSGYMKMNEVKNVYEKLKEISMESKHPTDEDDNGYLTPISFSNTYKVCPAPKPYTPPIPSPNYESNSGYLVMNNLGKSHLESVKKTPNHHKSSQKLALDLETRNVQCMIEKKGNPLMNNHVEFCEDKVQKELVEIINDFKNNVHSISQVESLVLEWKNRNDVKKSFKDKQEQLNEMRQRYEQIQQEMKNDLKKATPFERFKKIFVRHKHNEHKTETRTPSKELDTPTSTISCVSLPTQRPISSLSLQSTSSSSSSGRMSTISGCSVGDSGTHSDHEERKNMLGSIPDDDFRAELNKTIANMNYTIPPPPRPFNPGKFSTKYNAFPTIEERPPQPTPRTSPADPEMYYIQFPPSGLPVREMDSSKSNKDLSQNSNFYSNSSLNMGTLNTNIDLSHASYMNLPANHTKRDNENTEEEEEFHEYMNYVPSK